VRYTVRFDSVQAGFVAYGPSVDSLHYHFLGSQWMARVGSPDSVRSYTVRVSRGNLGGALAGSFGLGPGAYSLTARFADLEWTVVAGGAYREDRFTCSGRPVATLIQGAFQLPDDSIFRMSRAIVCAGRELFADTAQPFYSAIITARQNLRAGASYINAFSAFMRPDSRSSQVALLLAHEVMHDWLPRRLRLVPGPGEAPPVEFSSFHDVRYDWFHEGFTEYLARRVLVRAGLATEDWFAQRLNDDLRTLATHPYRALPAHGLEAAVRARTYTNLHQRISYHRGTLLAFRWDAAVRRASGGRADLVDVIRRLLAESAGTGGRIDRPRFERVVSSFGVPAAADVARHALGGEPIPVDSTGLGPAWVLRTRPVPLPDAGFDVPASTVGRRAVGVDPRGAAYAAGLRDGMTIVRVDEPQSRDAAPDAPLTAVVREGDAERAITIVPRATQVSEFYFERRT
jgi:predicted metalloprotease with PDZ domain